MNTRAGIGALVVIGLAFCGIGYLGLVAPTALFKPLGIEWAELSKASMNEFTAMYGGMHAALGLFFLIAAFVPAIRLGALCAAAAFLIGLVTGRVVSFVSDSTWGPMPLALVVVELMGVLITLGALLKRHAPPRASSAVTSASASTSTPPL